MVLFNLFNFRLKISLVKAFLAIVLKPTNSSNLSTDFCNKLMNRYYEYSCVKG